MQKKLIILLILLINLSFAVPENQINNDLNDLAAKIDHINHELNKKQMQQKNLTQAISDSNEAISKSASLLEQIQQKRNLDLKNLADVKVLINQINLSIESVQSSTAVAIHSIYQQIRDMQYESQSVLVGNDNTATNRKKVYMLVLLNAEQKKYLELQSKLNKLQELNDKLDDEIDDLDDRLGDTSNRKKQLELDKAMKIAQGEKLQSQINEDQKSLGNLKQKQAELNKLMAQIKLEAIKAKKIPGIKIGNPDLSFEDNSPFLTRKLVKPLNTNIAIPFGAERNGTRNNGVLFHSVENQPVVAISNGKVMYAGFLPGFGDVIVLDHGDNYMSIYGGIKLKVQKGQKVTTGQEIANTGYIANQPMGGIYFELRHMGMPVNPSKLVN